MEEECKDGKRLCPHPPKCIVCNGLYVVDYVHCPLKPVYLKVKGSVKRHNGAEVLRIRGQQKLVRNRVIRENRLQNEMAAQAKNPNASTSADNTLAADSSDGW